MNCKTFKAASIAALLALTTATANAATYNLSYTDRFNAVLTADIEGTLQPDGNTVHVARVLNAVFRGVAQPAIAFVTSYTDFDSGSGVLASLSLTGIGSDFSACITVACEDGFYFAPAVVFGDDIFSTGRSFGSRFEPVNPANFSLTLAVPPVSAVPLPAGGVLLLTALGGAAALRRKRTV